MSLQDVGLNGIEDFLSGFVLRARSEVAHAHKPSPNGILEASLEMVQVHFPLIGNVLQGAERRGHKESIIALSILKLKNSMNDAASGDRLPERSEDAEMDLRRHDVSDPVEGERRLVRENYLRLALAVVAPEGPTDQFLVRRVWEIAKPIDAAVDEVPVAAVLVVELKAIVIASMKGLLRSEVAPLAFGDLKESLFTFLAIHISHITYIGCKYYEP